MNGHDDLIPKYKVDLVVKGNSHLYDVTSDDDQCRYRSVTHYLGVIAKPALVNWAKREAVASVEGELLKQLNGQESRQITLDRSWIQSVIARAKKKPDQIKEQAADLGTQAHGFIDLIVLGKEPATVPDEIKAPVDAFRAWWRSSGIDLVMGDTKVASVVYQYAGSLDALGRRNGKLIVLDWKTSSNLYAPYALQVAAYAQAFHETYGVPIEEGIVVRFGKKPPIDFEAKELIDLKLSFGAFLNAKALTESLEHPHFMF